MYGVIDVGNCLFCRNVYTNVIFLQNGPFAVKDRLCI